MTVVLDASAVLALIQDESGAKQVASTIHDAILSVVTIAEIITKLAERGVDRDLAIETILCLKCKIIDMDFDLALEAGLLRPTTKNYGLSLGDRICVALAIKLNLPVLTTDKQWTKLDLPNLTVKLIR